MPVEVPPQGLRQPRRAEVAACRIGHGLPNPGEAHVGGPQLPRREALAEAGVPLSDWEDHDSDDALAAGFVELLDSIFVESVPAARRLMQLLEERGWSGWTQLEPVTTEARR